MKINISKLIGIAAQLVVAVPAVVAAVKPVVAAAKKTNRST